MHNYQTKQSSGQIFLVAALLHVKTYRSLVTLYAVYSLGVKGLLFIFPFLPAQEGHTCQTGAGQGAQRQPQDGQIAGLGDIRQRNFLLGQVGQRNFLLGKIGQRNFPIRNIKAIPHKKDAEKRQVW